MKIGILQCDRVPPRFRTRHPDYPEMIAAMLREVSEQYEFTNYPVLEDKLPAAIDECEAYITTGSRNSVNDQSAAFKRLLEFIGGANRAQKKLIGICFGHQAIALALGGEVAKSQNGWAVGVITSRILQHRAWMQPRAEALNIVVSHEEEVVKLPAGALLLGSNDHCKNYMFQYGDHFLGIQGHPEFSRQYSRDMMNFRKETIPPDARARGLAALFKELESPVFARWIDNVLQG